MRRQRKPKDPGRLRMKNKKIPMRRCVACGTSKPKQELIRIVTAEGEAEVDATGRKNGRGAYLCKDPACWVLAKKKRLITQEIFEELS